MKMVVAVIKPFKLEEVREALAVRLLYLRCLTGTAGRAIA